MSLEHGLIAFWRWSAALAQMAGVFQPRRIEDYGRSPLGPARLRLVSSSSAEAQVDRAIIDGGNILFMVITWSGTAKIAVDWRRIVSVGDAAATIVRALSPQDGDFTCVGRMFRTVSDLVLPDLPASVTRTVLDVSGDGSDNCSNSDTLREERDAVIAFKIR